MFAGGITTMGFPALSERTVLVDVAARPTGSRIRGRW